MSDAPKKRVALVYDALYPFVKGGAERRFYEVGKQLTNRGYEVHLYSMKFWDGPRLIKRDGMYLHGICKARELYTESGRRRMLPPILFGLSCLKLLPERFDVMDCAGFPYFSLFGCKLVTLLKRKPLYATWHEVWGKAYWRKYLGRLGPIGYLIERLAVKMPDAFIAVSDHTADLLKQQFKPSQPIYVVDNGIHFRDIKRVKPARLTSDIIYTGRLIGHKNVDVLLNAVSALKAKHPDVKCLIVGNGPRRVSLEKLSRELKLDGNVVFRDFVPEHDDIIALMKASKVFVLPSTREGFGLAALEANAAGLPVITTAHKENAARKLITGKNGATPDLEADAFAECIRQSLDGAYDQAACERAAKHFDWANIAHKLEAILQ
jgi:glycosyltransferase involved in cell wall biosynthesis